MSLYPTLTKLDLALGDAKDCTVPLTAESSGPDMQVTSKNGIRRPKGKAPNPGDKGIKKFAYQDFEQIKRNYQSKGVLFEDPMFKASHRLLARNTNTSSVEWLRPHEICKKLWLPDPKMFVGSSNRFDTNQGEIGNCWFLAVAANLAENKKCFDQVVPQDQTFDGHEYAGIFKFRFWRFGEWTEIVIDDRLPTRRGQLIYLRSVDKNEFWGALLEKAYAKLHGSYGVIEGGFITEAAVDFTGGIPELINLTGTTYSPEKLFYIMSKAYNRGAFMGAGGLNPSRVKEAQRLGLLANHAYTISKVVEIQSKKVKGSIPLVRVRNPHGNHSEWKGDWSDNDRNWQQIPSHMRSSLGLTFKDDGEFYMTIRDFMKYFRTLGICHLHSDSTESKDSSEWSNVFCSPSIFGSWVSGSTAGGCGHDGNQYFSTNPQHFINLANLDQDETHCQVIISIAQRQKQRKPQNRIGFKVYQCKQSDKRLDKKFFAVNHSVDKVDSSRQEEVSKRILLPPGRYCIVPCTLSKGEEGDYLLRVLVERKRCASRMDSSLPLFSGSSCKCNWFCTKHRNMGPALALKAEMKHLADLYHWPMGRNSEFDLLRVITNH